MSYPSDNGQFHREQPDQFSPRTNSSGTPRGAGSGSAPNTHRSSSGNTPRDDRFYTPRSLGGGTPRTARSNSTDQEFASPRERPYQDSKSDGGGGYPPQCQPYYSHQSAGGGGGPGSEGYGTPRSGFNGVAPQQNGGQIYATSHMQQPSPRLSSLSSTMSPRQQQYQDQLYQQQYQQQQQQAQMQQEQRVQEQLNYQRQLNQQQQSGQAPFSPVHSVGSGIAGPGHGPSGPVHGYGSQHSHSPYANPGGAYSNVEEHAQNRSYDRHQSHQQQQPHQRQFSPAGSPRTYVQHPGQASGSGTHLHADAPQIQIPSFQSSFGQTVQQQNSPTPGSASNSISPSRAGGGYSSNNSVGSAPRGEMMSADEKYSHSQSSYSDPRYTQAQGQQFQSGDKAYIEHPQHPQYQPPQHQVPSQQYQQQRNSPLPHQQDQHQGGMYHSDSKQPQYYTQKQHQTHQQQQHYPPTQTQQLVSSNYPQDAAYHQHQQYEAENKHVYTQSPQPQYPPVVAADYKNGPVYSHQVQGQVQGLEQGYNQNHSSHSYQGSEYDQNHSYHNHSGGGDQQQQQQQPQPQYSQPQMAYGIGNQVNASSVRSNEPLNYDVTPDRETVEADQMDALEAAGLTETDVEDVFSSARHGRVEEIEKLLDQGIPVDIRDSHGNTLLTIACQNGNKRVAKAVLRRSADINARNYKGNTPLHYCFSYGYGDTLGNYLIEKGADAEAINNAGKLVYDGI
jgi:hypothetical protein